MSDMPPDPSPDLHLIGPLRLQRVNESGWPIGEPFEAVAAVVEPLDSPPPAG
ncbi:MAG TPA: hypothetical protein VF244_02810 [Acidimicrobiales bacterium]